MSDFSKKQIFKSEENTNITNITIRLKANGFVLCGFSIDKSLILIDEMSFLKPNLGWQEKIDSFVENFKNDISGKNITIIYPATFYSLVPSSYFDSNHLNSYFAHAITHKESSNFSFHYSEISGEIVNINATESALFEIIEKNFQNTSMVSDIDKLIRACTMDFLKRIEDQKNFLYLNFSNQKCDVVEFSDGKLMLASRFSFNSIENFIYHILNVIHQTNQFVEKTEVVLLGDIEKQSGIVLGLSRYFNRIHFFENKNFVFKEGSNHNFIIETFV